MTEKPTYDELVEALKAAARSLGDAECMNCTDQLPTLCEDSSLVDDVLGRL